jgi:malate dehydrogenase
LHGEASFEDAIYGVMSEVYDCCFPLVESVVVTSDYRVAFRETDFNFLIGASPRLPSQKRAELLLNNAKTFVEQGKALNDHSKMTSKTVVIGNPPNTNALVLASQCS